MIPSIGSCSRLYSCSQKVAFHVHASRLLCRSSSVDFKQSDISLQAAFEEDKRSVVDGMNEMNVKDDEAEESTRKRKTRGGAKAAPRTCSEAIEMGLDCFNQADYEQAVELFTIALELPGNGAMRLAGSVKEYACPSEGEEHAALYNMACCYSKLGEIESGLTCLKGLLESGFDDYDTLRTDKDLEALRASKDFAAVVGKHDNLASKLLGRKKRKTDKKKGWLARW